MSKRRIFRKPPGGPNDALETEANLADPARAAFFADCDAFVAVVADQYFELSVAAIKAADPNHLVIGSRFGYQPHSNVIAAAGRYLDVISFNCYDFDASPSYRCLCGNRETVPDFRIFLSR